MGELKRRFDSEGQQPGIVFFDNIPLEVPLHVVSDFFENDVLLGYPHYTVEIVISGETVLTGIVDHDSIVWTSKQTVRFEVLSLLSILDRHRFPDAWQQQMNLADDWYALFDNFGSPSVTVTPTGEQAEGFWPKILLNTGYEPPSGLPAPPLRPMDILVHPQYPEFWYQVWDIELHKPSSTTFYRITLDRPWYSPSSGPQAFETIHYHKREFLGEDFFDATHDFYVFNSRKLAQALFAQSGLPATFEVINLFAGFPPVETGLALQRESNPVKVLLQLLASRREYMIAGRDGILRSFSFSELLTGPDAAYPEIDPERVMDSETVFAWDKRVDRVKVIAEWQGETVEVVAGLPGYESGEGQYEKTINIVGTFQDAQAVADTWLAVYGKRRMVARIKVPMNMALSTGNGPVSVGELDLLQKIRYASRAWWIDEFLIRVESAEADLTLISVVGWPVNGVAQELYPEPQ